DFGGMTSRFQVDLRKSTPVVVRHESNERMFHHPFAGHEIDRDRRKFNSKVTAVVGTNRLLVSQQPAGDSDHGPCKRTSAVVDHPPDNHWRFTGDDLRKTV